MQTLTKDLRKAIRDLLIIRTLPRLRLLQYLKDLIGPNMIRVYSFRHKLRSSSQGSTPTVPQTQALSGTRECLRVRRSPKERRSLIPQLRRELRQKITVSMKTSLLVLLPSSHQTGTVREPRINNTRQFCQITDSNRSPAKSMPPRLAIRTSQESIHSHSRR